jgi:hypothetical protein
MESYEISPEAWDVMYRSLRVVLVWAGTNSVVSGPRTINSQRSSGGAVFAL